MIGYSTIPFSPIKYDFVKPINDLFFPGYQYDLKALHNLAIESYPHLFEIGKDSSTCFHKKFYDKYREGWDDLRDLYERFIKEVVSVQFCEDFLYQAWPTFRVHLVDNVAVGAFHNDAEFGHPEGEINFIIPLTDSQDTASVWMESEPGKKDFHPINLRIGRLVMFNGNKLTHGNKVNVTGKTRVSMDFRVLPISKYNENNGGQSITRGTKFVEGQYYKRFKW